MLYAKMLKETETEKAIGLVVLCLSLVTFQLGGTDTWAPWQRLCTFCSAKAQQAAASNRRIVYPSSTEYRPLEALDINCTSFHNL